MRGYGTAVFLFSLSFVYAQYAPPAGKPGTTAMHRDSSAFKNWAAGCTVVRGPQDISDAASGEASAGEPVNAAGKADGATVSLGDGGYATCTFHYPIINGPGPDFAIFENSINDDFLELAFVEVSSDGSNFFRFKSHSLTDTATQTDTFGSTDATKINNLAGKYRAGFGTPFDLGELAGEAGLNVNSVSHIRVRDVVGSVQISHAKRDGFGNKINDPWPTPFPSSGFDLDGIGVIHQTTVTGFENYTTESVRIFPNPVKRGQSLHFSGECNGMLNARLYNVAGEMVAESQDGVIGTEHIDHGIYLLKCSLNGRENVSARVVVY